MTASVHNATMHVDASRIPDLPVWCLGARVFMAGKPGPEGLPRCVRDLVGTVRGAGWCDDNLMDLAIEWLTPSDGSDPFPKVLVENGTAGLSLVVNLTAQSVQVEVVPVYVLRR